MSMRRVAIVVVILGVLAVWIACLVPMPSGGSFQYKDKLEHIAAYLIQAASLAILFPRQRRWILLGFLCQGALIELLQGLSGYRSAEWADMAANSAGIVLGLALSYSALARRASHWLRPAS